MKSKNSFQIGGLLATLFTFCVCTGQLSAQVNPKLIQELPTILAAKPPDEVAGDDELQKLLRTRYNLTHLLTVKEWLEFVRERITCNHLLGSARRLSQAGMALHDQPQEKLGLLKQMTEFSNKLEGMIHRKPDPDPLDVQRVHEFRLELEIERFKLEKINEGFSQKIQVKTTSSLLVLCRLQRFDTGSDRKEPLNSEPDAQSLAWGGSCGGHWFR